MTATVDKTQALPILEAPNGKPDAPAILASSAESFKGGDLLRLAENTRTQSAVDSEALSKGKDAKVGNLILVDDRERPTVATDKQIDDLANYLAGSVARPGDKFLTQGMKAENDRSAEWLRNRFEEEYVSGGNIDAMQRKMNESLAKNNLEVEYFPSVNFGNTGRKSQLSVKDRNRMETDLFGDKIPQTIGFAYDFGMPR